MKIFLTGGSSFIGKNFIEKFSRKYDLYFPTHQELNLEDAESVFKYLKDNCFDIVLHVASAGTTRKDVGLSDIYFKNQKMFFNLIRGKQFFNRMVVIGSGAEYDKRRSIIDIEEDQFDNLIPIDQYSFSKYSMAKYAQNVDFITHLRPFAVYGKYEDYQTRFISNSICKALMDLPITIKQNVYFDYLYINDFINILDYFIENNSKQIFYNIARGKKIDLVSIAKKILLIVKKDLPIIINKDGLNNEYTSNINRLKEEIKNLQYTDFDKSIEDLISYYENILPQLDKELFLKDV